MTRKRKRTPINWAIWSNLKTVNARSAVQLSLCLNPDEHIPMHEKCEVLRQAYWDRSILVKSHATGSDWLAGRAVKEDGDFSMERNHVDLKLFARWLLSLNGPPEVPPEFITLVAGECPQEEDEAEDEGLQENASDSDVGIPQADEGTESWTKRSKEVFVDERNAAGSLYAAGQLHGVSRQRYSEIFYRQTGLEKKKRGGSSRID